MRVLRETLDRGERATESHADGSDQLTVRSCLLTPAHFITTRNAQDPRLGVARPFSLPAESSPERALRRASECGGIPHGKGERFFLSMSTSAPLRTGDEAVVGQSVATRCGLMRVIHTAPEFRAAITTVAIGVRERVGDLLLGGLVPVAMTPCASTLGSARTCRTFCDAQPQIWRESSVFSFNTSSNGEPVVSWSDTTCCLSRIWRDRDFDLNKCEPRPCGERSCPFP